MKALRNLFDNLKPHVEKDGKFHYLHSTFDAFHTLFFVPNRVTKVGAHIRDYIDSKRSMALVVLAMMPALFFGIWNVGYHHYLATGVEATFMMMFLHGLIKVVPIIAASYTAGLAVEFTMAQIRGHEVNEGFLVSGMLVPLIVPVDVPLWMVFVATAFALLFGKEVFGGTGMNILNPALTARAFLFFAYPAQMSGDFIWISGLSAGEGIVDGFSGATCLAQAAAEGFTGTLHNGLGQAYTFWDMFLGVIPGSIGETSTLMIMIGAVVLLVTGIGNWKIMLSFVLGGLAMGLLLNGLAGYSDNAYMTLPAHYHLVLGGFAFGAVFMVTDPVSAAQTDKGKWIYGFLAGFFSIMIRVLNPAYPEGVMLSILLMNVFAPLIDHYVIQGHIKRRLARATASAK